LIPVVEEAGGQALPCIVDIRDEQQVMDSVAKAVSKFGGIDIGNRRCMWKFEFEKHSTVKAYKPCISVFLVINNASAISLTKTQDTDMKRYDLMHQINGRGTFLV